MLRKTGYAILLLAVVAAGTFLFVRWRQSVRLGRQLDRAERLMPDSSAAALCLLDSIDGAAPMSGRNHARYALLLTQAQYKNDLVPRNDSLIRIAVDYYFASSDSLRKAWSCFYMAQTLRDTYEPKRALDYFRQAASAASATDDNKLRLLVYSHWGAHLQPERPYEMGLNKLLEAKKYAETARDTINLIYILRDIGWSYVFLKDLEHANSYFDKGIELATQKQQRDMLPILYKYKSVSFQHGNHSKDALRFINKALSYADRDTTLQKELYTVKLLVLNDLQQYDSAYYYLDKIGERKNYYSISYKEKQAYRIQKGLGDYKEALKHHERYALYLDSDYIKTIDDNLAGLQKKYDYTYFEYENIKLKNIAQSRNIVALVASIALLLLLFIGYFLYLRWRKKKNIIIETKDAIIRQYLWNLQKKTNELLQQRLVLSEKELALKETIEEKELLTKDKLHNEKLLEELSSQQQMLKERIFGMNEIVQRIEGLHHMNDLQKRKQRIDLILSEQDLKNLFEAMNFCYNNFEERLRANYPSLTNEDIYVCCLVRMNVGKSDIALLLSTNEEALKKRKYRIKRDKIGLGKDDVSLDAFLAEY